MRSCNETFQELDQFLEHTKVHESRAEMNYRCHLCNKQFSSLDDLGTHQLTHSAATSNLNSTAESRRKKSLWWASAVLHLPQSCYSIILRMTEWFACRKWKCTKCGNQYSSPEALEHHMSVTTHSNPCPLCNRVFPCERYLRRHLASHDIESKSHDVESRPHDVESNSHEIESESHDIETKSHDVESESHDIEKE